MNRSNAVLSAENLKVELGGVQVLDIPDFYLYDKELLTVVGPNGSGKSTLLLTLACLLSPVSGRISYRGEILNSHDAAFRFRRKIAMVFQEPLLFDTTVYHNVASGLRIRNVPKSQTSERTQRYLKMFNIDHLWSRSARKLSGGESQRTSLARAFAIEPDIILLDEPFSALDPPTRHDLIHDLDKVVKATGTTTIMVTHVEFEALNLSGRIAVMNQGKIVQIGSPTAVIQNPANEFVAKLVGMETVLSGKVLECCNGLLTLSVSGKLIHAAGRAEPDEEILCGLRPENVLIGTNGQASIDETYNSIAGKITDIYSVGPFIKVRLDCGFPLAALVTREQFADAGLEEGKAVTATFKPASVHLIPNRE